MHQAVWAGHERSASNRNLAVSRVEVDGFESDFHFIMLKLDVLDLSAQFIDQACE